MENAGGFYEPVQQISGRRIYVGGYVSSQYGAGDERQAFGLCSALRQNLQFASTGEYRGDWPESVIFSAARAGKAHTAD